MLACGRWVVRAATVPGSIAAFNFGSVLAAELDYEFGAAWLSASYVLWLLFLGIGTGVVSPRARREERALTAADAFPGEIGERLQPHGVTFTPVLLLDAMLVGSCS